MLSLSKSKAFVVFLIFAGLVLVGLGVLASQNPDDRITESQGFNEVVEEPDAGAASAVVTGNESRDDKSSNGATTESAQGTEVRTETEVAGPPPLFPTKDLTTRKGFYLAFSALCRKTPEEFRKLAQQAWDGDYPLAAKEAALAAWYDWNHEDRLGPYDKLLAIKPTEGELADGMTVRLQAFAVKNLSEKAPTAAECRATLATYLETRPANPKLRKQAFTAVLRWGHLQEIHRCLPSVLAESDPDCLKASAEALHETTEGAAELILRDLAKRHPRSAAREQFKQILAKN